MTDRIHDLCSKVVSMPESPELHQSLKELREALRGHVENLRAMAGGLTMNERRHFADKGLDAPAAIPSDTVQQTYPTTTSADYAATAPAND